MGKRKKRIKNQNKVIQFNVLNFKSYHYYLFNVTKYNNIIQGISDLNDIKINADELNIFKLEVDKCNANKINIQNKIIIKIIPEYYDFLNKIEKQDLKKTEYAKKIKFIINYLNSENKKATLKLIAKYYEEFYEKKISITTVSRILKNHLEMRYLRTSIKNPKLEENNYIFMCFIFLRVLLRSLILHLNIIYVDETGFVLQNNNFYTWREKREEIYDGAKSKIKERINLILAISNNKVVHKKFLRGTVDSNIFIQFLDEMIQNMQNDEKQNSIIIFDNATYHLTNDVIQFFKEKKLKGLTICPYRSNFNSIELVFRYVKNIIYKNVYNKMEDLKNDVDKILNSNNLKNSLINLFKETIQQYILFIQNHDNIDLSNFINKSK